jgi:Kef-type K+ transport system membrane component KefB
MSSRRIPAYYAVLGLVTATVTVVVLAAGAGEDPQPSIAGGYDVAAGRACLGEQVDIRQSGEFLALQRPDGSSLAKPKLSGGRVRGTVSCADGRTATLDATVRDGVLAGTAGGAPVRATFAREPPDPGAQRPRAPGSVAGDYKLVPRSACLGGRIALDGSGSGVGLEGRGGVAGELTYAKGTLSGRVRCSGGGAATLAGMAANRDITLTVTPTAAPAAVGGPPPAAEKVSAQKQREFGGTLAAFFLALVVVMLFARLTGAAAVRIGQPRVMGEVAAGILLGPTVLGATLPDLQRALFPSDIIPYIGVAANLGLIFYMFLVGLELDVGQLRGRVSQALAISNTGVAVPMMAGLAIAVPIYPLVAPDTKFIGFALFMGVSMSITAFPVLARILVERRMLKQPVGALALAAAAIDDVSAWFLIALATAVALAGSAIDVVRTVALAAAFCIVMFLIVRRVLARMAVAYDEAGSVPAIWVTAILAGVLLSAYATEEIGIALIFGAFVMGAVMPRHAGLTEDVTHRMEDFVVLLLLPLFFCFTGLRTNVLLLDRESLIVLTLVLVVVAIACKFGGTLLAARVSGMGWRESSVLGALMNTRGLTELIVLNLALEKGVISDALFAALVLMALITTFMAGPLLNRFDPEGRFSAPVEDELADARRRTEAITPIPMPDRAILVAPQSDGALEQLVAIAEPLARSEPPRELIIVRLVTPPAGAAVRGGLQTEARLLASATETVQRVRSELLARQVAARAVALPTRDTGEDLRRLMAQQDVDLLLLEGRRPLLGGGVPRGTVGAALEHAPSDVAVLVAREGATRPLGPDAPLVVPFGGQEHDWAALELAAWLSSATGAPLMLLGAAGQTEEGRSSDRLLANASLLVQRLAGVTADAVVTDPGAGIVEAAAGAGLLLIGLSDRWRQEGLGATRSAIAKAAPAPVLFVRRGTRPGALAPREDVTRFTWSSPGIVPTQPV